MHVGWGSVEDEWTRKMHEYMSEKSPVRWGSTGGDKWVHAWTDGEGKQSERQTGIIKMHQRDTGIKYLLPIWVCVFLWAVAGNCPYYSSCPKTSPLHATDTHTHTLTDWQRERERESDGRGVSSSPGLKHVQDEWQSISVWVRGRTERHSITEAACVPKCVTACLWCVRGARRVIADECVCPTLRIYVWVWERAWVSAQRYVSWWQSSLGTGVFVCERNKVCVSSCAYFSVRFQCSQWACALRMCVFVCLERERETERASIALISSQPVESSRCCSIQKECRQSQTRDRGRGTQVRERGEGVKEAEREIREKRKEKREEGSVQRRRKW